MPPTYENTPRGIVNINGRAYRKKIRIYDVDIVRSAVAGAQFSGVIQINPTEVPFMLGKIHVNDSADTNTLTAQEDFFVSLQDNESGYNWTDGYTARACVAGDRTFGWTLPEELPVRGNTRITVGIQNKAAGPTAGTATVSLVGYELWPM